MIFFSLIIPSLNFSQMLFTPSIISFCFFKSCPLANSFSTLEINSSL